MIEFKLLIFSLWALGTAMVIILTFIGKIRTDHFNNVPWSQCLKSPQHQLFLVTIMAWLLMISGVLL